MSVQDGVSVNEATHVVTTDGRVLKVVEKWGLDAAGRPAKPSEGGFGVVTEDGCRVSMWQARRYLKIDQE